MKNLLKKMFITLPLLSIALHIHGYKYPFFNRTDKPVAIAIQFPGDNEPLYRKLVQPKSKETFEEGKFEIPTWDPESQKKVREALLILGSTLPDSKHMFGTEQQTEPVRRLIGAAMATGPAACPSSLTARPARSAGRRRSPPAATRRRTP